MKYYFGLLVYFWLGMGLGLMAQEEPVRLVEKGYVLFPDLVPQPLNLPMVTSKIPYPEKAYQAGIEGLVQVQVQVDQSGNYVAHQVVYSPHYLLSEAVEPFIACLTFEPARLSEKPVPSILTLPFRFVIRGWGRNRIEEYVPQNSVCPNQTPPRNIPAVVRKH